MSLCVGNYGASYYVGANVIASFAIILMGDENEDEGLGHEFHPLGGPFA